MSHPIASLLGMTIPARAPKGAQFAYDTAIRSLDDQLRRIESLDSKAGILIGAGGVLAGLLAGGRSLLLESSEPLALATAVLLILSLVSALVAFFNRSYSSGLSAEAVTEMAWMEDSHIRWRFHGNLLRSLAENGYRLQRKARLISISLSCLILATLTIGVHLCIVIAGGN